MRLVKIKTNLTRMTNLNDVSKAKFVTTVTYSSYLAVGRVFFKNLSLVQDRTHYFRFPSQLLFAANKITDDAMKLGI